MMYDVVIVGAGPAGLSAARMAAEAGLKVALIDDQPRIGGQYFRHAGVRRIGGILAPRFGRARYIHTSLSTLGRCGVEVLNEATVVEISADRTLTVAFSGSITQLQGENVVIATGARERVIPFPGWTTPGVIGAGAAQNLMKASGVLPGSRVVVVGANPLCLLAATSLLRCGVKIVAVCAPSRPRVTFNALLRLMRRPDIFLRGVGYLLMLKLYRIRMLSDYRVTDVIGDAKVTGVITRRFAEGLPPSEERLDVDLIVVNDGLLPNIELASRAGCEIEWEPSTSVWSPKRNADFETTIPHVYAVGDCVTASGVENSLLEGEIVAISIAASKDVGERGRLRRLSRLKWRWRRLQKFRSAVVELTVKESLDQRPLTDDTIVCRCEDVSLATINDALCQGVQDLNALKAETRVCMGRCQGRTCMHTVLALLATAVGKEPDQFKPPVPRLPLRPVKVGDWLKKF
ncbi:Hydrogen cyanide synthase HcnB [Neorhizobium galegae bv. officinalis]|nr:Hydrogen cyanide synthase HcnB [Neorhizobium galegae bv. officinalis]